MDRRGWYQQIRDARRARGWTQSALARQAECAQSAISMMENGRRDALSRETLLRILELLQLDAALLPGEAPAGATAGIGSRGGHDRRCFCPIFDCPSNHPFVVQGELRFLPSFGAAVYGPHCPYCGELLESACPNAECAAPVNAGACCVECGAPYVVSPLAEMSTIKEWLDLRRERHPSFAASRRLGIARDESDGARPSAEYHYQ